MNIFYVNEDPKQAAQDLTDKHVVKMILESAQILSTAHRLLDGVPQKVLSKSGKRMITHWSLPDEREDILPKATHVNHPCCVWVRESHENYIWLFYHFSGLLSEYTYRYGKQHAYSKLMGMLLAIPKNMPKVNFSDPPKAMPDEYKTENVIESYRYYYANGKAHLHEWTKRQRPNWLESV